MIPSLASPDTLSLTSMGRRGTQMRNSPCASPRSKLAVNFAKLPIITNAPSFTPPLSSNPTTVIEYPGFNPHRIAGLPTQHMKAVDLDRTLRTAIAAHKKTFARQFVFVFLSKINMDLVCDMFWYLFMKEFHTLDHKVELAMYLKNISEEKNAKSLARKHDYVPPTRERPPGMEGESDSVNLHQTVSGAGEPPPLPTHLRKGRPDRRKTAKELTNTRQDIMRPLPHRFEGSHIQREMDGSDSDGGVSEGAISDVGSTFSSIAAPTPRGKKKPPQASAPLPCFVWDQNCMREGLVGCDRERKNEAMSKLFTRMACTYHDIVQSIPFAMRDNILHDYPIVLTHALLDILHKTLPYLRWLMDAEFRKRIYRAVTYWTLGIEFNNEAMQKAIRGLKRRSQNNLSAGSGEQRRGSSSAGNSFLPKIESYQPKRRPKGAVKSSGAPSTNSTTAAPSFTPRPPPGESTTKTTERKISFRRVVSPSEGMSAEDDDKIRQELKAELDTIIHGGTRGAHSKEIKSQARQTLTAYDRVVRHLYANNGGRQDCHWYEAGQKKDNKIIKILDAEVYSGAFSMRAMSPLILRYLQDRKIRVAPVFSEMEWVY